MTLRDFIDTFVLHNSMVRLWKPIDLNRPCNDKIMLTYKPIMEWEAEAIPVLSSMEVYGVTDILCESYKEAINIVVKTTLEPFEASKLIAEWEAQREKERSAFSDG